MLKVYDYDLNYSGDSTIDTTLKFAIEDASGVIRLALGGHILVNGDTFANVVYGNTPMTFQGGVKIYPRGLYTLTVSGGVYSITKWIPESTVRETVALYGKNGTYASDPIPALYPMLEGVMKIPNVPQTTLQNFTFDRYSAADGGASGAMYLCVSDTDINKLESADDLALAGKTFADRLGTNDIFLFANPQVDLRFNGETSIGGISSTAGDIAPFPVDYLDGANGAGVHPNVVSFVLMSSGDTIENIVIDVDAFSNGVVGQELIIRTQVISQAQGTGTYYRPNYDSFKTIHPATNTPYFAPTDHPDDDALIADDDYRCHCIYSGPRIRNAVFVDHAYNTGSYRPTDPKWTGFTNCVVDPVASTFGFELGVDGDYNDFFGVQSDPLMDIEVIGSTEYYVDITAGTIQGLGTVAEPFNYEDFYIHSVNHLVDGDHVTYNVRGYRRFDDINPNFYFVHSFGDGSPFDGINITVRGWDIDTNGSPIVEFVGTNETSPYVVRDYGSKNATFEDFIFVNNHADAPLNITPGTFKDVLFNMGNKALHEDSGRDGYFKFYGCTFNCSIIDFQLFNTFTSYDCVYHFDGSGSAVIGTGSANCTKIVMSNNITNVTQSDFSSYINAPNIDEYNLLTSNAGIQTIPNFEDNNTILVETYTNRDLMHFSNFNIPLSYNSTVRENRLTYDYNNGLFGAIRSTYGAYAFAPIDRSYPDYPTSGVIGAFYFGGEYANVGVSDTESITITPVDIDVSISMYSNSDNAEITINVPDDKTFAIGNKNFYIDFVGKEQRNTVYPKFCECDTTCSIDEMGDYSEQIAGGNPLVVNFSACAHAVKEYDDYNPVNYKWWFDFENHPNEYVTCAGPSATHNYCGSYLEQYDVRLCVEFK